MAGRKYGIPNTIRWIGDRLTRDYVPIPHTMARSDKLSADAKAVALLLRSHATGWNTSQVAVSQALGGWGAKRTRKAFAELVASRWLVVQEIGGGKAVYFQHRSRPFTETEAADLLGRGWVESTYPDAARVGQNDLPCNEGGSEQPRQGGSIRPRQGGSERPTKEDDPRKLSKKDNTNHVGRGVQGGSATADAAAPMQRGRMPDSHLCRNLANACGFGDESDDFVSVILRERFIHDPHRVQVSADWNDEFAAWVRAFSDRLDARNAPLRSASMDEGNAET